MFKFSAGSAYLKFAAEVKTELLPHQKRVLERLEKQPGLVVAHGLGTGKTLSSIAAGERAKDSLALVPASLVANYEKEQYKHLRGKPQTKVKSVQSAVLRNEYTPTDLLIVDEAHRAREANTQMYKYLSQYPAEKRMLLTASPVYNRPSDIATLINLAAQDHVLPVGSEFDKKFIQKPPSNWTALLPWKEKKTTLRNKGALQDALKTWVDYQSAQGQEFPEKEEETVYVEMSPRQTKLHDFAWGKLPFMSRLRLKQGLPPNKQDMTRLNQFQSQTRQIGGSTQRFKKEDNVEEVSPKVQRAFEDLQRNLSNPRYKGVIYSNYLDTLSDYDKLLTEADVPHYLFTGKQSQKERKKAVEDYNEGRLRALLISSAGGEGLDLKGTRQLQVLEPHWNDEKLNQVIGRAIRHQSHADLPENERNVQVQQYIAYPKPGFFKKLVGGRPTGVEQVLYDLSKNKTQLNNELLELLK